MIRIGSLIPVLTSLVLLTVAAISDLTSGRIPNLWVIAGLAAGILFQGFSLTPFGWGGFFLGMFLPLLICWIPFCMGAVGAGDVKLLMALGTVSGGPPIFYCIFFSFLFAAGISLCRLLRLGQLKMSLIGLFQYFHHLFSQGKIEMYEGRRAKGHTIHFAVAILLGYLVWLGVNACGIIP